MASGGYQPSKQGRPEPQRQTNWQRSFSSDRDDAHSLHSLPGDMRINNWDLADLHPSNLGMNSKRRKKSKGNPEREREQSLSMDSPPSEKKHHMPSSYPRTKITANTPTSQRVALENIRLHMTFSDVEDDQANIDGERNNERQVRRKQWSFSNGSLNRTNSDDSIRATSLGLLNQNNNMHRSSKEQGPDRNEIVARLTQIRDFMKQASSMLDSLEKLGSKKRTEDVEKVRRLIRNLQEQEHGYKGLLLNSMKTPHDEADDDKEDETAGDEDDDNDDDDDDKVFAIEAMECSDGNISDDLGAAAEVSEASPDSRPRRESQLGIDSDGNGKVEDTLEEMFLAAGRESAEDVNCSGLAESDQTTAFHSVVPVQESQGGLRAATFLVGEGMSDAARQNLLQILKEKEQQLQALMSRQEELNILRLAATKKLAETKDRDNIASTSLSALIANRQFVNSRPQPMQELEMVLRGAGVGVNEDEERSRGAAGQDRQLKSNIVGFPESDDEDNSKVLGVEALPSKLLELKQQLTYLKNEFSQISEDPNNIETDAHALADGGQQLQNKLCELQNKKLQLDTRLHELQLIHSPPSASSRNNEGNPPASNIHHIGQAVPQIPATLQQQQQQQEALEQPQLSSDSSTLSQPTNLQAQGNALASFADVAGWPEFGQSPGAQMVPGTLQGLQEKLRSLKEVREQLDYLKSAVKFNHNRQTELEDAANGDGRQPALGSVHGEHASLGTPTNTVAGSNSSSSQLSDSQLAQSLNPHPKQRLKQLSQQQQPQRKQPQSTQIQRPLQPQEMQIPQQPQSMQIPQQLQPQSVQIPQRKQSQSMQIPQRKQPQSMQIPQQKQYQSMQIPQQKQPQSMQIPQQKQPQSMQKQPQSMQIPQQKQPQSQQIQQQLQRKQPQSTQIQQQLQQKQPQSTQIQHQLQQKQPQSQQIQHQSQQKQPQSQQIQQQLQQMQQQTLKPTVHRYPQQQVRDRPEGTTATAWSRNMTQLLNLEVTDPGDEHSDEDNVSASKSESVWSVFESWDNGPDIHEKLKSAKENLRQLQDLVALVRQSPGVGVYPHLEKLKSAKENLRQLQDLVALVQQSPDAAGGVSEEQAGRAASVDGVVVLHAAQTVDLNVSFSEGELPSESLRIPHRDDGGGETEDSVAELENLRRERSLLFEIQSQLQRIHGQRSGPGADAGEVRDRPRQNSVREKSGLAQASSTPVVTFASNDELYSKIRRQRILHEELRSKKKELEAIMKKDRNRKQYSRNQDNQSDSVSLATDTFGAAASVDATMATWGGSTADNLENITEDEDGQEGDSSGRREEDNEDEDVDSTSRNRSSSRNVQRRPNLISREKNQRQPQNRQQDDDVLAGPNADWYRAIESRLSGLTTSVEALLKRSNMEGRQPHGPASHESAALTSTGPTRQDQQQLLQLQNQSLMLSFGQLVQTLTRQQGDIQHLQQQVQSLQLQIQAVSFEHMPPAVAVSLPSPFRQSQPSPVVSTCSSRHRTASMGVHPIIINHQQKPHLQSQINVNNTNLPGSHSAANSGFPSVQSGSLTVAARHLPQGADKTPADGACSNLQLSQPKSLTYQGSALGKSGKQVKKPYSDSTSGARISAPRSGNLGEDRSRVYRGQKGDGRSGSMAPAVGVVWARMNSFDQDESDYCSSRSVSSQCSGIPRVQAPARPTDSGAATTDSSALFDTMRDTIYTEVASLISQNENRPYFLLGLFRDMQRVDSDLMRQQALNSLQELVSSDHRNIMAASSSAPTWSQSTQTHETANTGLIPSKDVTSEDDDDDDDDDDLSETQLQEEINAERSRLERVIRSSTVQSQSFDYAEPVDHPSSLSTPTNADDESLTFQRYLPTQEKPRHGRATRTSRESTDKRPSTSEPRKHQHIDTTLRDQQVRSIMKATTAFLQEHIGDECSVQLLNYIVCLVISSIMTGGQEVVRLFQQQLTSVLEGALLKYQGRRVRDCIDDVVVEISDVLNSEPAYFEPAHNFADRVVTGEGASRDRPVQMANSEHKSEYTAFSRTSAGVHDNIDDGHKVTETSELENDDGGVSEQSFYDAGVSEQSYTVELAQSERKPFTRIGSDEDDDEGDELWSMNDPSETAVSRDARLENGITHHPSLPPPPTRPEAEGAREDGADKQTLGQTRSPRPPTSSRGEKVDGPSGETCAVSDVSQVNGSAVDLTSSSSNQEGQTPTSSCEKLTLPAALPDSTTRSDSLELRGRYEEEQTSINGLDAVLSSLGGMEELASDEASVLGPDLFSN